jgi:hypothetical protein
MVHFSDQYLTERLMRECVEEALQTAEMNRWVREAGLQRQGWLSRTGCWLLCRLGRLLEAWGQRLQERYQLPPLSLEEQTA